MKGIHNYFAQLFVEFENFVLPMHYSSRNEKKLDEWKLSKNDADEEDKQKLKESVEIKDLALLKKYLTWNPLEDLDENEKWILFKCWENYQTIPSGL